MAEGEEWKTAFRTRYGLFKSLVMLVGLTNTPADFPRFINETLAPVLDHFTSAYLDDILIYSDTMEEHTWHVHRVLERLTNTGLHLKPEKCEFHKIEVKYLELIIGADGIKMDPSKVETVKAWPPPEKLRDVRAFLGFANFYCRFVKGYSKVVEPLIWLTRKGQPFKWETKQQESFTGLKTSFTMAPILRRFDHDRDIVVETDITDFISTAFLSQYDEEGTLHPVAFFSKKHSPAECNYEIYDKELMAIVRAFEEWLTELQSVENPISVLTEYKNLEYFMTTKLLNRRQARWAHFLSQFNFKIIYRPGKSEAKPDSLTRRFRDLPKEGDKRLTENFHAIIKPHQILRRDAGLEQEERGAGLEAGLGLGLEQGGAGHEARLGLGLEQGSAGREARLRLGLEERSTGLEARLGLGLEERGAGLDDGCELRLVNAKIAVLFSEAYNWDPFPTEVLAMLEKEVHYCKDIMLSECSRSPIGRLLYRGKFYVPAYSPVRLYLIQMHHEVPVAGHPGRSKTLKFLSRNYYWPKIWQDVERFVRNCHTCRRSKTSRHASYGVLCPLAIPQQPWQDISMDFVMGLSRSKDHDAIRVVVDRLTKQRHLVLCSTTVDVQDLADLFLQHVFRFGLPRTITSD